MHPVVHHAFVVASVLARRFWVGAFGAIVLATTALLLAAAQSPSLLLQVGVVAALSQLGLGGLFLGQMAEPGGPAPHDDERLPALPIAPRHRLAAELVVLSAATLLFSLPLAALPLDGLPQSTLVTAFAPLNQLAALGILLPGMAAGRRMRRFGSPAALGPLLLAAGAGLLVAAVAVFGHGALLVGALLAGPVGALVFALEDAIDRASEALDDALPAPGASAPGAVHEHPLRLAGLSLRTVGLPALVGLAPLMGLQLMTAGPSSLGAASVFGVGCISLVFAPLGLDGRVALRSGRTRGFDGRFLWAWATLPVHATSLRRAALRQASFGAIAAAAVASVTALLLRPEDLLITGSGAVLTALGAAAVAGFVPLIVASQLGDRVSRRIASGAAVLVAAAALTAPALVLAPPDSGSFLVGGVAASLALAGAVVGHRLWTRPYDPDEW